tara:strand:- start:379 stop:954 length:576 start_codon:yes stop_codon:yes gene_type:complete
MKLIGLTGGIGSGKSTFLYWFKKWGVPCFESDLVGRKLLDSSLKRDVILRFGDGMYVGGKLDRRKLSEKVFSDSKALNNLNEIVHPAVEEAFKKFSSKYHKVPFIINESAILFETGIYKKFDKIILITSPKEERVKRVSLRDKISENEVLLRMEKQLSDKKKIKLADFVIENITIDRFYFQAKELLIKLRK